MAFVFERLKIPDVLLIRSDGIRDSRGSFMEMYKKSVFEGFNIPDFLQENQSYSIKNVIRGLHYQKDPHAQGKLVRCIKGEIFDVAVDIRDGYPTKYNWVGVILSEKNHEQLYIPEGFAHGFCVISNEAEVVYKCTSEYEKESESGILWNDPKLNIIWPISSPILSEKDKDYPFL